MIEKKIKIVVDSDDATEKLQEVNETLEESNEATEGLTGSLDSMTGGAITGFKKMLKGIKAGIVAMKSFRTALISTGIGALIVAVASLAAYFTSTEEGANKLQVAFAAVGATVDKLVEGFAKAGKFLAKIGGIIKDVVKGDKTLKEGWEETKVAAVELKDELVKVYNEIKTSATEAMDLQRRENQLRKDQRNNLVEEAKLLVELSKARLLTDDQRLTTIERIEALNEAERLNNEIYDEKIRQKKEEYLIQKERNALSDSTEDDLLREAELQAELINLEAERNSKLKESSDKKSALLKSEEAKKQAAIDKDIADEEKLAKAKFDVDEKYKKLNQDAQDVTDAEKIQRAYDRDMASLAALNLTEQEEYNVKKYYADLLAADEKKKADESIAIAKMVKSAKVGIAFQMAGLIQNIAEEGSSVAKAAAVTQTTISTIQGATGAFNQASALYPAPVGQIVGGIAAGLVAANGATNIKKILSTNPSGISSKPSIPSGSGGGSTPRASSPSFNLVQGTAGNQIADSVNQSNDTPIKAYVVSSEVSTGQELDRKVIDNASI